MANQNYRIFPNKVELFKFFGTYAPDLNVVFRPSSLNGFVSVLNKGLSATLLSSSRRLPRSLDLMWMNTTSAWVHTSYSSTVPPNPNRRGKAVEAIVGPKGEEVKTEEVKVKSAGYEAILAEAEALNDEADKSR